jgi:hypothetical protein
VHEHFESLLERVLSYAISSLSGRPAFFLFFSLREDKQAKTVLQRIRKRVERLPVSQQPGREELNLLEFLELVNYEHSGALEEIPHENPKARRDAVLRTYIARHHLQRDRPFNIFLTERAVSGQSERDNVLAVLTPWSPLRAEKGDEKGVLSFTRRYFSEPLVTALTVLLNHSYVLRYRQPDPSVLALFLEEGRQYVLYPDDVVMEVDVSADILALLPDGYDRPTQQAVAPQLAFRLQFEQQSTGSRQLPAWVGHVTRQSEVPSAWIGPISSFADSLHPMAQVSNALLFSFTVDQTLTAYPDLLANLTPETQLTPQLLYFDSRAYSTQRNVQLDDAQLEETGRSVLAPGARLLQAFGWRSLLMLPPLIIPATFLVGARALGQGAGIPLSLNLRTSTGNRRYVAMWKDDHNSQTQLPSKSRWNRYWIFPILLYHLTDIMSRDSQTGQWEYRSVAQYRQMRPLFKAAVELEINQDAALLALKVAARVLGRLVALWMKSTVDVVNSMRSESSTGSVRFLRLRLRALEMIDFVNEADRILHSTIEALQDTISPETLMNSYLKRISEKLEDSYEDALSQNHHLQVSDAEREALLQRMSQLQSSSAAGTRSQARFLNREDSVAKARSRFKDALFHLTSAAHATNKMSIEHYWKDVEADIYPESQLILQGLRQGTVTDSEHLSLLRQYRGQTAPPEVAAKFTEAALLSKRKYVGNFMAVPREESWRSGVLAVLPFGNSPTPVFDVEPVGMQIKMSGQDLAFLLHNDVLSKYIESAQILQDPAVDSSTRRLAQDNLFVLNQLTLGTGLSPAVLQHSKAECSQST